MRAFLSNYARLVREFVPVASVVAIVGGYLVTYGVSLIYVPAGFITGGIFLIAAAIDGRS
jgi:alpha-D-ribose 1-methylphosphonate 5-phosphate C-P lyase